MFTPIDRMIMQDQLVYILIPTLSPTASCRITPGEPVRTWFSSPLERSRQNSLRNPPPSSPASPRNSICVMKMTIILTRSEEFLNSGYFFRRAERFVKAGLNIVEVYSYTCICLNIYTNLEHVYTRRELLDMKVGAKARMLCLGLYTSPCYVCANRNVNILEVEFLEGPSVTKNLTLLKLPAIQ